MAFCQECKDKKDCKAICQPLEKYLCSLQAENGYCDRHYRRKTVLYNSVLIEKLASYKKYFS